MVINDSNYEEVMAQGKPAVLDFSATWCGPCQMIEPIITELAAEYDGKVIVGKVDIDDEADDLVSEYGIRNVPTVLFIKDGTVVDKMVGAAVKAEFVKRIEALLK